ncbi:MAG: protein kinase [Myxococcota bacterium]|nr:protein kinase [Myxococcota bacterium]
MRLRAGDEIGTWLIEDILGEGSMGVVYRSRGTQDVAVSAAVKVSKSKLSPRARKRFLREADLLEELDHEAIIRVHSKGEDAARGLSWFAMELLEGLTFRERIQKPPPLPVGLALALFARISDGLAYAHERNIFHRDLKPSNLFLCLDSSVRILDFGVGLAVEWSPLTATDQQMGTYAYMPPEVFRAQTVDPARGDIYGLGLVLYEVLLGEEVFLQPLTQMTTMKINAEPMDLGADYPEELRALVLQATDPRPEHRLSSMQEFADRVLELSLEFPPESDEDALTDSMREEIHARAVSGHGLATLIPSSPLPPSPLSTGVRPMLDTRIDGDPPEPPPDHWMLKGHSEPLSRARILERIGAEQISGSALIARPGGSWREIRYHPSFRAYFVSRLVQRRALSPPPPPRRRWPALVAVAAVLLGGTYAIRRTPALLPASTEAPVSLRADQQAALATTLAAMDGLPDGDLDALRSEGQARLRDYTRAGAREALRVLAAAAARDLTHIETLAGLAEAAARLEDTDDLTTLADLSLAHARHLSASDPAVARAELFVERLRGDRTAAVEAAPQCSEEPDCTLLRAAAELDLDTLHALTADHPERPGMGLVRLAVLLEEQDWPAVLASVSALTAALPDEPLPHRAASLAAAASGAYEAARVSAERAAVLEAGWLDMPHLLGQLAHRVDGHPDEARAMLSALTTTPGFPRYTASARVWRDLAAAALDAGDPDQALEAADAALQSDPTDPSGTLLRAWALHERGDRAGFLSEVSALSLGELTGRRRAEAGLAAATMEAAAGLNRQALLELEGAAEADPTFTPTWLALAGVQARLNDSRQVVLALETAALHDSALLRTADPLDASWSPSIALAPSPEQLRALLARDITLTAREDGLMGVLYWLRGEPQTARPLLAASIASGTPSASVHAAMGQLQLHRQRHQSAVEPLATALKLVPGRPLLTAMHSYALAVTGEARRARVLLAGLSDSLQDPAVVIWKARAHIAAGEDDAAHALLTRHLQQQRRDPVAQALLLSL